MKQVLEKFMREMKIDRYTPVSKLIEGSRSMPGTFKSAFDGAAGGEETAFTASANSCCVVM